MKSTGCIFVGNRRFVLESILQNKMNMSAIAVVAGSHLDRDFQAGMLGKRPHTLVQTKENLLHLLRTTAFDLLIANGCPYILPIGELPPARYVNIHPSFLPDLRGIDPVIGAVLLGRDAGATCHVMDKGVDTGDIIAQVRIPSTPDLDVTTLYQLSFMAEKKVFDLALALDFQPQAAQSYRADAVYYSRRPEDMVLHPDDSNDVMLRKIKAFNNRSIGCQFFAEGKRYKVFSAMRMKNAFLVEAVRAFDSCVVAMCYEDSVVFHRDGEVLRFMGVAPLDEGPLTPGKRLFGG